ncbi:hypothetical protein Syun_005903 [Stephania yunnanensis]|uniref:Uncharacterized protein n=1 Tax=Stephania yunnanensis TaxID=152371 RepID=A0AAP0PX24_9MAGN
MEVEQLEEALRVISSSISGIKWRLKPASKRRLEIDILALCTGLRPLVMVDYGGKMPELQEHLCSVVKLSQKESAILEPLRVMVVDDMIYLLHSQRFAEYIRSSLNSKSELLFVDLERDPPKMVTNGEQSSIAAQFESIQKVFSRVFATDGTHKESDHASYSPTSSVSNEKSPIDEDVASQPLEFSNLSSCLENSSVTIPTLNGWLLGYPVVYLFSKDHIADAVYNLSTKSLRLFKILICRNGESSNKRTEELMSFSVPYDLSMGGKNEPWAEAFLARMLAKLGNCKHVWRSMELEVSECYPQAIAL